jgi:multicomponent Na+:H+ antiporter subunit B
MNEHVIIRVAAKLLFPFFLILGIYVVTHGEISPGGGFQGGVILAAAFILYGLVYGTDALNARVPRPLVDALMALGALMYAGTGFVALLLGSNFLDYSMMNLDDPGAAEALGMSLVEYGVTITVFSVMLTIFTHITEGKPTRPLSS